MAQSDDEWDQRILCSDGDCIGIIGADGRCKVCGLSHAGERPSLPASATGPFDTEASAGDQSAAEKNFCRDDPVVETSASDDSWDQRTLCIDGNCIGVVGPDGRCKECGKPCSG